MAAVAGVLAGGCASNTYQVKVEAISRPQAGAEAQSYALKSKNPVLGEEKLRYREAAEMVRTALSGRGLYEAAREDLADMIVELDYGVGAQNTRVEYVSVPVYAPPTASTQPTRRRSRQRERGEVIGFEEIPRVVTLHEKYMRISARENRSAGDNGPPAELWVVQATTEDESRDLRKYIPIMASATVEYMGLGTDEEHTVRVRDNGPEVEFVRRGMPEATPAPAAAGPKS